MNNPSENSPTKFPPMAFVIVAVLLWSTGGLFIKMTTLDALAVNFGRSFLATLTIALFTYKKGLRFDKFTLISSLLYAGTLTCFVYANKMTTAANAIFLQYTAPIYILIFAPILLREKFQFSDLITVAACLGGMSLFFLEPQNAHNALATNVFLGNILALASGAFLGFYLLLLRHPKSLRKNPALSAFYGNIIIVLVMLPFIAKSAPQEIRVYDILAILFLGIFQIGIAYILFNNGVARGVRALDASIIGFIEPLLNPIWVFIFLSETPSKWAVFGGVIIITAVILHTIQQNRFKSKVR